MDIAPGVIAGVRPEDLPPEAGVAGVPGIGSRKCSCRLASVKKRKLYLRKIYLEPFHKLAKGFKVLLPEPEPVRSDCHKLMPHLKTGFQSQISQNIYVSTLSLGM